MRLIDADALKGHVYITGPFTGLVEEDDIDAAPTVVSGQRDDDLRSARRMNTRLLRRAEKAEAGLEEACRQLNEVIPRLDRAETENERLRAELRELS